MVGWYGLVLIRLIRPRLVESTRRLSPTCDTA